MVLGAVCQLTSGPSLARNLSLVTSLINRASSSGARIVFFPEASDFLAPQPEVQSLTAVSQTEFVDPLLKIVKDRGVWLSIGVHEFIPGEERCFNTQLLVDPDRGIVGKYRKVHLFDVDIPGGATILESRTTKPGEEMPEIIDTPIGKLGPLTCYDLRFPELSLGLRSKGAQIITFPSAFTLKTGRAHWEVLLKARAIETQCYIVAAAQVGDHTPSRASYGESMIVDPWGDVCVRLGKYEEGLKSESEGGDTSKLGEDGEGEEGSFGLFDFDLSKLDRIREDMPLWKQRRNDLYPTL